MRSASALMILAMTALVSSCSASIPAKTKLVSSSLSGIQAAVARSATMSVSTEGCMSGAVACITPTNASGMIYYAGIMVGEENGYSIGLIGPLDGSASLTKFESATVKAFDLAQKLEIEGAGITCCEGTEYPADDQAFVTRMELFFAYIDVAIEFAADESSTAVAGAHTVRVVYGDFDEYGYKKGDLLYKGAGDTEFKWCDTSGCTYATRPASPLAVADIANYAGSSDGKGSQHVPAFTATMDATAEKLQMTKSEVTANSWEITVDFIMTNAVSFTKSPAEITSVADLLQSILFAARPGGAETGFTSIVTATKTAL